MERPGLSGPRLVESREITYNPEFDVMQILTASAEVGSVRMGLKGRYSAHALAFRSPDRTRIRFAICHPFPNGHAINVIVGQKSYQVQVEAGEFISLDLPAE